MMSEHTKEPWDTSGPEILACADETKHIATCWNHNNIDPDEQDANARRIVACVNACKNISTEALEHCKLMMVPKD